MSAAHETTPDGRPRRTRRRPTRQALSVAGAGVLLVMAGSTAQAGWLFVLAAGVLGLATGSLLMRHRLEACDVARAVPARLRVGDDVRVGLTVHNTGRRSLPMMSVSDSFVAFDPITVASERVGPDAVADIELVRTAARRGRFSGGDVTVSSGAPFGLMRSRRIIHVSSPVTVVPRWVELASFPILEPSSSPSDTVHERARTGAGEEFLGVRDYRPGDPQRAVHWRSTARAGHPVVREYEEMTLNRVAVVIAGPDTGEPPESAFEAIVSAAASVALYALQTGHPVEFARWGEDGTAERLVDPGKGALLEWLAGARPAPHPPAPLAAAAARSAGRRATVVVCTSTPAHDDPAAATGDLEAAVREVQMVGSRAIVVAAIGSSWATPKSSARRLAHSADQRALDVEFRTGRAPLRVVTKGEDLRRCLHG